MFPILRPLALGLCAALLPAATFAQSPEFYKGKTVGVYIGFSPGGTYDLFGRLVARHIGKHIPGNPTVVASTASIWTVGSSLPKGFQAASGIIGNAMQENIRSAMCTLAWLRALRP